jgi:hypothetical protein
MVGFHFECYAWKQGFLDPVCQLAPSLVGLFVSSQSEMYNLVFSLKEQGFLDPVCQLASCLIGLFFSSQTVMCNLIFPLKKHI